MARRPGGPSVSAANVTTEDVRRAYYAGPGASSYSMWVTEIQITPPQLIVGDEAAAKVYRVPYAVSADGEITFSDPVEVSVEYMDVAPAVAASRARGRGRTVRASGGVTRQAAAYKAVMAAFTAGAVSPQAAVRWARWVARGGDISVVGALTGSPQTQRENAQVRADADQLGRLSEDVLSALQGLVSAIEGDTSADDTVDPAYQGAWPPGTFTGPTNRGHDAFHNQRVFDPGGQLAKDSLVVPAGHGQGSMPYASSGRRDRYDPGEMTDAEADALFPPTTRQEAQQRHQAAVAAAAGRIEDLGTEELHDLLFGSSDGRES